MIETILTLMVIFFAFSGFIAWIVVALMAAYYFACMPGGRDGK
jgi:Na+/alanine symporter